VAHFTRSDDWLELMLDGSALIERTAHADARQVLQDERAALIAYYRRIAELLDDRWIRTTRFVDDIVLAEEPALVADVDAGDRDALAVYTDWLLERGDPRGELAALRLEPEPDRRRINSLERRCGVEVFGALASMRPRWWDCFTFVWRAGWVDEILFHYPVTNASPSPPDKEVMQHALHAPMARFARWLQVDDWYTPPIWECLGDCTCLRKIRGVRCAGALHVYKEMLDNLPALEEIEAQRTSWVLGGHPRVRRMRLTVDEDHLEIRGDWPSLKKIELVLKRQVTRDELSDIERFGAEITMVRE
jgi:hypothetical protein